MIWLSKFYNFLAAHWGTGSDAYSYLKYTVALTCYAL